MKKILKNTLYIVLAVVLFQSCVEPTKYRLTMIMDTGTGWNEAHTFVKCDSVQFIDKHTANIWIDGTKQKLIAEELRVYTNHTFIGNNR